MLSARAERADGWVVDDIPHYCSFCFCDKGDEHICIAIECFEPSAVPVERWPPTGPDPDSRHAGQDRMKRVRKHQALNFLRYLIALDSQGPADTPPTHPRHAPRRPEVLPAWRADPRPAEPGHVL